MSEQHESIIQSIFLIAIILLFFNWVYHPYIKEHNAEKDFLQATEKNLKDEYSLFYADLCKSETSIKEQVNCVMLATSPIYHYTKDQERKKIRTPSEYINFGGNCKDSAVFYATIFKNLNYTINFEFPIPRHLTLTIYKKTYDNIYEYCTIEGNRATCYEVRI